MKHNIFTIARHIVARSEGRLDRQILHPARDWTIGLTGVAFLFLAGSVGAGYLFWSKNILVTETYVVTIEPVQYDQKLIKRVLAEYTARQVQYELLRDGVILVPKATSTATSTVQVKPAVERRLALVAEEV